MLEPSGGGPCGIKLWMSPMWSQFLGQGPFTVVAKQIVEEECPAIASPGNPALNLGCWKWWTCVKFV